MPCGSAFAVQRVDEEPHPAPGLLVVEFQQTEVVLLQRAGAAGEAQEQQNRMFQHPALTRWRSCWTQMRLRSTSQGSD